MSELCQIPPQTPVKHRDLRGHAEADCCWGKSLSGSGRERVGRWRRVDDGGRQLGIHQRHRAVDGDGERWVDGDRLGSEASGSSDTGLVMNACGTFDPNRPGDSVIPQDPDDPDIIAACTALCEALASVPDCNTDATTCLDTCKMRSCNVCPGTLVPLVDCETEMFAAAGCSCGRTGAEFPTHDGQPPPERDECLRWVIGVEASRSGAACSWHADAQPPCR